MAQYNVNPDNVARIAIQTMQDLSAMFDKVECVLGLSEALARIIVDACDTPIQMQQLTEVANEHLKRVIEAGVHQKGFHV